VPCGSWGLASLPVSLKRAAEILAADGLQTAIHDLVGVRDRDVRDIHGQTAFDRLPDVEKKLVERFWGTHPAIAGTSPQ